VPRRAWRCPPQTRSAGAGPCRATLRAPAQIFSLVVASVGLAAFAIVLSLVEQLVIQARAGPDSPIPNPKPSLVMAPVGLAAFAIELSLVEQLVIQARAGPDSPNPNPSPARAPVRPRRQGRGAGSCGRRSGARPPARPAPRPPPDGLF